MNDEERESVINERGPDGLPTAAASKAIGEEFDQLFPHGTLCDCVECLKREVARLREDLEDQARYARRDRAQAVRATADREATREELREAIDELANRQEFVQQVIADRDRLFKARNKIALDMANVRDEAAAALQEAANAKEEKAEIVSDRDEMSEKIYALEELLGAIWLYVNWHYVTKQLTTEQKELWANAVDKYGDPEDRGPKAERWWRK
jgi:hypothetical protein